MTPSFLINGQSETLLAPTDRGLAYGDGVFRTMRVINGIPETWDLQYEKLQQDCRRLRIACPSDSLLLSDIARLFDRQSPAVCKIIVTRGQSQRGYAISPDNPVTRILLRSPMAEYPADYFHQGVRLHLCETRLAEQPQLAGIKHLNRLENVLARMEWTDPGIADGILLDRNEHVIEGTMSNVFARFGSTLITPDLTMAGIAGVTRDRILNIGPRLGLNPVIRPIPLTEFMEADEIIICNSLITIWQVTAFNQRQWQVGDLAGKLRSLLWTENEVN